MNTHPKISANRRRKRRAVSDLFRAIDTLVAAANEAGRATRTILHDDDPRQQRKAIGDRLIVEFEGRLKRGSEITRLHDAEREEDSPNE